MHKSGEHDFWTCTGDLVKKDPLPVLVPKKEPAMMHPWLLQDEKKTTCYWPSAYYPNCSHRRSWMSNSRTKTSRPTVAPTAWPLKMLKL
jgi:hypothetical protein